VEEWGVVVGLPLAETTGLPEWNPAGLRESNFWTDRNHSSTTFRSKTEARSSFENGGQDPGNYLFGGIRRNITRAENDGNVTAVAVFQIPANSLALKWIWSVSKLWNRTVHKKTIAALSSTLLLFPSHSR
jgi:hypothetical protein